MIQDLPTETGMGQTNILMINSIQTYLDQEINGHHSKYNNIKLKGQCNLCPVCLVNLLEICPLHRLIELG